jgi:hypothetical protein
LSASAVACAAKSGLESFVYRDVGPRLERALRGALGFTSYHLEFVLMKASIFAPLGALALTLAASAAHANNISTATGPFTPSFRGGANTTYFGWEAGTWDGNVDTPTPNFDTVNSTPSINPSVGPVLTNNLPASDIVSGSNNLYPGPFNLTLAIPTAGTEGTGFTTIVIQGNSLPGFPGPVYLDTFKFGDIAGIAPTYIVQPNSQVETQWWAKWEIPGNQASYNVNISATATFAGVASVTDMVVDTQWSAASYAADVAVATPEPASLGMLGVAATGLLTVRRRQAA